MAQHEGIGEFGNVETARGGILRYLERVVDVVFFQCEGIFIHAVLAIVGQQHALVFFFEDVEQSPVDPSFREQVFTGLELLARYGITTVQDVVDLGRIEPVRP